MNRHNFSYVLPDSKESTMTKFLTSAVVASLGLVLSLSADAGHSSRRGETPGHRGNTGVYHGNNGHRQTYHNDHRRRDDRNSRVRYDNRKVRRFSSDLIKKHNGVEKRLGKRVVDRDYFKKHAKRFAYKVNGERRYAWKYPGRYHRHWKFYCYNRYYRKWLFYDDCCGCYYYYCSRCTCYLPVEYSCGRCLSEEDDENVDPCADTESSGTQEDEEEDCCN
jgi:hypothetical protein